jgi:membrane fusion protein (multidrug efflux system)
MAHVEQESSGNGATGASARPATDRGAATGATPGDGAGDAREPKRPLWRRPIGIVAIVVLLAAVVVGIYYWLESRRYEETDDAFIEGSVVPISPKVAGTVAEVLIHDNQDVAAGQLLVRIDPRDIAAQLDQARAAVDAARSRLEAARTLVETTGANTSATLLQSEAGVAQARAAVTSAEAQLASAEADVTAAKAEADRRRADLQRFQALDPRALSQQQLDAARAAAESANAALAAAEKRVVGARAAIGEAQARVTQAQAVQRAAQTAPQQVATAEAQARTAQAAVAEAEAQLRALTLQMSYTSIHAPVAGRITRKSVNPGQNVQPNQALFAIVSPDVWVVGNFKETQLAHLRRGQDVDIDVDAYPGRSFRGHVDSVAAGTGARFSLLPPENATGNYVKVVQRVPVKILFDENNGRDGDGGNRPLLSLGMSVVPRVHIEGGTPGPLPISPPATAPSPPSGGAATTEPAMTTGGN